MACWNIARLTHEHARITQVRTTYAAGAEYCLSMVQNVPLLALMKGRKNDVPLGHVADHAETVLRSI